MQVARANYCYAGQTEKAPLGKQMSFTLLPRSHYVMLRAAHYDGSKSVLEFSM